MRSIQREERLLRAFGLLEFLLAERERNHGPDPQVNGCDPSTWGE